MLYKLLQIITKIMTKKIEKQILTKLSLEEQMHLPIYYRNELAKMVYGSVSPRHKRSISSWKSGSLRNVYLANKITKKAKLLINKYQAELEEI